MLVTKTVKCTSAHFGCWLLNSLWHRTHRFLHQFASQHSFPYLQHVKSLFLKCILICKHYASIPRIFVDWPRSSKGPFATSIFKFLWLLYACLHLYQVWNAHRQQHRSHCVKVMSPRFLSSGQPGGNRVGTVLLWLWCCSYYWLMGV